MRRSLQYFLAMMLCACVAQDIDDGRKNIVLRSGDGEEIMLRVEVVLSPEERARGLMFRESLGEHEGMVFVFDQPQVLGFWMKNTYIPLDVLFFDKNRQFVTSATMEPCLQDPCRTYSSEFPVQFALEVPAGFTEREKVAVGWTLSREDN